MVTVPMETPMRRTASQEVAPRDEIISVRASREQKALMDRAAQAVCKSRSDFMLETACREAQAVLLDRCYFAVSEIAFWRFTATLNNPPAANPKLRRLLHTKAPWDQ